MTRWTSKALKHTLTHTHKERRQPQHTRKNISRCSPHRLTNPLLHTHTHTLVATHGLHITAPCSSTFLSSFMHIDTHLNSYTWKDQDGFPLACYNINYHNWIATSNCRWGCFASGTIKILRKSLISLKSYLRFSYPVKGILLLFSNVRSSHDLNAQQIEWCYPKEWNALRCRKPTPD